MKKVLGLMLLAFTVSTAAPAFAHVGYVADANNAPKSEWAQSVIDQSQDQGN